MKLFPRARAAQAGWKKLTPAQSRLPVTFELMCGMVHTLWAMGRVKSALVVMLCFSLYLRPGEPHRIRCRHVVAPMKAPSGSKHVTVVLYLHEDGRASKTHEYDESLLADQPLLPSLGARLLALARSKTPDALLFDVTQQRVASDVELSCHRLRVPAELSVVRYMFRQAGASTDFARKVRQLAEIKLRGRWKGDPSLRRYEK